MFEQYISENRNFS